MKKHLSSLFSTLQRGARGGLLILALMATTCLVHSANKDAKQNSAEEYTFAISKCPVIPVRLDPSETSEQTTQLLFGEVCEVLDHQSRWVKIRSTMDGQEGWVSSSMIKTVDEQAIAHHIYLGDSAPHKSSGVSRTQQAMGTVLSPMAVATAVETGEQLMLTIGTRLPKYANGSFEVLGKRYLIDANSVYEPGREGRELTGEDIVRVAKSLLNVSYLWGGKNMMGYDCSGFTQTVYSVFGFNLLRNAREQVTQGEVVKSLAEAQPGDLVFFNQTHRNPNATRISHVGMLISPTEVIHCAGRVHIAKIDDMGIRLSNGKLSHSLAHIKRYL